MAVVTGNECGDLVERLGLPKKTTRLTVVMEPDDCVKIKAECLVTQEQAEAVGDWFADKTFLVARA